MINNIIKSISALHDAVSFLDGHDQLLEIALEQGDMPTVKYLSMSIRAAYNDLRYLYANPDIYQSLYAGHIIRNAEQLMGSIPALLERADKLMAGWEESIRG